MSKNGLPHHFIEKLAVTLVVMSITTMTFAARDFSAKTRRERRAYLSGVCEERATKSG